MAREFDPRDVEAYAGRAFITASGSRYEIKPHGTFEKYIEGSSGRCQEDSGEITIIAGIKPVSLFRRLFRLQTAEDAACDLEIPGYYADDKNAYNLRLSEATEKMNDFALKFGRVPREGDKLFLGIKRPFEEYNDIIKNSPDRAFPWLTPFILTSPIEEII